MMQLQQRLASGSQASCSYAARPTRCSRTHQPACPARQQIYNLSSKRLRQVCRAVEIEEAEEIELDTEQDTIYDRMPKLANIYPDYDDPEWISKVGDWEEFWYATEDVLEMDDEDIDPIERSIESLSRARQLVTQLADMRKRKDVEQMIAPRVRPSHDYEESYTTEEEWREEQEMHRIDPNPDWNLIDVRAMAEKRRQKAIMDAEWRRQQTLLSRPYSFTLRCDADVRLQSAQYDWIRESWTDAQIQDLLIGGGKFVHPDKVKVKIMNPLLPADYHNDYAVRAVPDTEEFLEAIGHLATEDEILHLKNEVSLEEADFVDPTLMFEDDRK
eukprot:GHRR01022483.1.p1 GENE.GHRR01022483.1~~GHRR01022483.1.p1  ORF type:complete len:329 (+),score=83.13 GHRR01022483.1:801-1787(+)